MNYGKREHSTYYDWKLNVNKDKAMVAVDQQKFNLAWLVFPEIEEGGLECTPDSACEAINKFMDKATRATLCLLPLTFLAYWKSVDDGRLGMAEGFPGDYLYRMEAQAAEAQRRLLGIEEEGNVVRINFRRDA